MLKSNTIQNQILFGFFLLIFVMSTAFAALSFFNFEKLKQVRAFREEVEQMSSEVNRLVYVDNRVLTEGLIDSAFYLNQETALLSKRRNIIEKLKEKKFWKGDHFKLDNKKFIEFTDSSFIYLEKYGKLFAQMVDKKRERGFKDYGLEGAMRKDAHSIEHNYTDIISLESLLSLRRHEKDYFLRKDSLYVAYFNGRVVRILQNLESSPKTMRRSRAEHQLRAYQQKFNTLFRLESKIENKYNGLKYKLMSLQNYLQAYFEKGSHDAKKEAERLNKNIYYNFLRSSLIALFFVVLGGYWVANFLAKPVRKLATKMEQPLEKLLTKQQLESESGFYASAELQKLEQAFKKLLLTVEKQIQQINKSKDMLARQNKVLVGINEKLSSSEARLQKVLLMKDKFFSIVAHDLKGPVGTLTTFLDLFIRHNDKFNRDSTHSFAKKMKGHTESLSEMLENLLAWSRSDLEEVEVSPTKVKLKKIIDRNFTLLAEKVEKKKIVLKEDIGKHFKVWADENVLDFVLRNLLNNAVKFSHRGGEVVVGAQMVGDNIQICVKDQGVGIAAENIEKVFDVHARITTKGTANEPGTGLGLPLVKEFVEKSKGKVWVESKEGEGSTFKFTLPQYDKNKAKLVSG